MNNLQLINENFHASNLSKYQYTISLINECVRCEILPKAFLYNVQIKISEILKDLIMRYTKGESTSVTVEKAEKLIIGIWYTIDAYMKTFENLIEVFGLDKKKKIRGFSKGMQRQTEIILGLASNPKYLLLDETFDGLDPQKKEISKKLFLEYIVQSEASIIISSHNLTELSNLCDHVGLINGKKLTMDCCVDDISQNYCKFRLIFDKDIKEADFAALKYKSLDIDSKIATIIFEGNAKEQAEKLKALNPIAIDEYKLTMEEVFLNEMEDKKYDITKIFE